jgi:hypothetical protein
VSSRKWGVFYTFEVKKFRNTLTPAETELFNECVVRIYRDPRVDRKHKFTFQARPPLVDTLYRDDNFVLIYLWAQLSEPFGAYRVTISHAAWTYEFDKDSTIPRR